MSDNIVNARIQLKNDIEANWDLASNFIPRQGEIIIYNADSNYSYPRIKIGDGSKTVSNLPFINNFLEDRILVKTSAEWAAMTGYIPAQGLIMIYSDRNTLVKDNVTYNVAGVKIGDGKSYGSGLPFIGDDIAAQIIAQLTTHIDDTVKHITDNERTFWNNKLNCSESVQNEILVLNRL